jgi:hypothetical protein
MTNQNYLYTWRQQASSCNLTEAQLYNKVLHYCRFNSLPLLSIISHVSPIEALPHYLFNIEFSMLHSFATRQSLHIFRTKFLVPTIRLKFTSYISFHEFMTIWFFPYCKSNHVQLAKFFLEIPLFTSSCTKLFNSLSAVIEPLNP